LHVMGMPPTIQMANLGMADSLILMVMALVVFGPRRLPQIGRQIGKLMYEFRKASNDFKFQMEEELRLSEDADRRKKEEERVKALALAAPKPAEPAPVSAIEGDIAASAVEYTSESMISPSPASKEEQAGPEVPRIQPPSSGDPVEAQRPNRAYVPPSSASSVDESESEGAAAFVALAGIEADTNTTAVDSQHTVTEHSEPAEPEQAVRHG
jgi:sec-independent protein translocase protein TatB